MKSLTIVELSKLTGFSRSSVSRALRNDPTINAKTRDKILKIAAEHNYRPNPFAVWLTQQKRGAKSAKGNIAFLLGHKDKDPLNHIALYKEMYKNTVEQAEKLGYHIDYYWIYHSNNKGKRLERILQSKGTVGIFYLGMQLSEVELDWNRYAIVNCGHHHTDTFSKAFFTSCSMRDSMKLAFEKIAQTEAKSVGLFLRKNSEEICDYHYTFAYQNFAYIYFPESKKIPPFYYNSMQELNNDKHQLQRFQRWFEKNAPEVIIGSALNYKFLHLLSRSDLCIVRDFKFLDLDVMTWKDEKITGVLKPYKQMSKLAVQLIVNKLNTNKSGILDDIEGIYCRPNWQKGTTL